MRYFMLFDDAGFCIGREMRSGDQLAEEGIEEKIEVEAAEWRLYNRAVRLHRNDVTMLKNKVRG